jgi:hypothetical protein
MEDLEYFKELETKLHKKSVRNSPDLVSELLSDDFIEFGSSGNVYDKTTVIESLKNEQTDLNITTKDFKLKTLSDEIIQLTYRTVKTDPLTNAPLASLRSSIWKLENNKWRMIFHQGTKTS